MSMRIAQQAVLGDRGHVVDVGEMADRGRDGTGHVQRLLGEWWAPNPGAGSITVS